MTITARGAAFFCGAVFAGFAASGFLVSSENGTDQLFLLASWLLPIALWPAATLAAALDADMPRDVRGQAGVLWPAYIGLALYAAVSGSWWLEASSRGTHENFAAIFMLLVMAVHAFVFVAGGFALVFFQKTRPAAFQMWIGYGVLIVSWIAGSFLV